MPKIIKKLTDKGYPTHNPKYKTAHEEADKSEKKKFPKDYAKLKKSVRKLSKHELMGKNLRSGKIEVEKKFKPYAREISYHEKVEHKNLTRLNKKSRSK